MWMFRWLQRLFAHRAAAGTGSDPRWVEPSNAITRAILAGMVGELPLAAKAPVVARPVAAASTTSQPAAAIAEGPATPVSATMADAEDIAVAERSAAQQPATRTAQRTRRRRASRAA